MKHYPTLIFRLSSGMLVTKPIHVVGEDDTLEREGIILVCIGGGLEADGSYTLGLRKAIDKIGRNEMIRTGLPACVVYGPNDCVYIREDGNHIRTDSPPPLGEMMTTDNYDPEIGAEVLADFVPVELDIGNRPLLPVKKKAVVL